MIAVLVFVAFGLLLSIVAAHTGFYLADRWMSERVKKDLRFQKDTDYARVLNRKLS